MKNKHECKLNSGIPQGRYMLFHQTIFPVPSFILLCCWNSFVYTCQIFLIQSLVYRHFGWCLNLVVLNNVAINSDQASPYYIDCKSFRYIWEKVSSSTIEWKASTLLAIQLNSLHLCCGYLHVYMSQIKSWWIPLSGVLGNTLSI